MFFKNLHNTENCLFHTPLLFLPFFSPCMTTISRSHLTYIIWKKRFSFKNVLQHILLNLTFFQRMVKTDYFGYFPLWRCILNLWFWIWHVFHKNVVVSYWHEYLLMKNKFPFQMLMNYGYFLYFCTPIFEIVFNVIGKSSIYQCFDKWCH